MMRPLPTFAPRRIFPSATPRALRAFGRSPTLYLLRRTEWMKAKNSGSGLSPGGFFLLEGVIGGAYEGAGFDMLDSQLLTEALEFGELVGVNEARHRQMLARRLQVLPQCQDVRALRGNFSHGG